MIQEAFYSDDISSSTLDREVSPLDEYYDKASKEQAYYLRSVLGDKAADIINLTERGLLVPKIKQEFLKKRDEVTYSDGSTFREHSAPEQRFSFIQDGRVIMLNIYDTSTMGPRELSDLGNDEYLSKKLSLDGEGSKKVVYVDFVMQGDLIDALGGVSNTSSSWEMGKAAATSRMFFKEVSKEAPEEDTGSGILPGSLSFMRLMKTFVQSCSKDSVLVLSPSNLQRGRIYERVFRDEPNVIVKGMHPDL